MAEVSSAARRPLRLGQHAVWGLLVSTFAGVVRRREVDDCLVRHGLRAFCRLLPLPMKMAVAANTLYHFLKLLFTQYNPVEATTSLLTPAGFFCMWTSETVSQRVAHARPLVNSLHSARCFPLSARATRTVTRVLSAHHVRFVSQRLTPCAVSLMWHRPSRLSRLFSCRLVVRSHACARACMIRV